MDLNIEQLKGELANTLCLLDSERLKIRDLKRDVAELTDMLGVQMRFSVRLIDALEKNDD